MNVSQLILPFCLEPKPSYVGLYVRQKRGNGRDLGNEPLATYSPLEELNNSEAPKHLRCPELAGVKVWPARGASQFDPLPVREGRTTDRGPSKEVQNLLFTLPPGTVFKSRLTFHNLRRVEFGALLWALSFGDTAMFCESSRKVTKRHRLGMGKPLGWGKFRSASLVLRSNRFVPTKGRLRRPRNRET